MNRYLIISDEVTGVNGFRYFKNSEVDENQLMNISELISANAISLIEQKMDKKTKE